MKTETKHRARQEILHYVLTTCVSTDYGDGKRPAYLAFLTDKPKVGDLVILESTSSSKWTIGWLTGFEPNDYEVRYLIESLEDGQICSWGNCGLKHFPRDKIRPEWRWTDRQWAFKVQWWNVAYKVCCAYSYRPLMPEFGEGNTVTLGVRRIFEGNQDTTKKTFLDYRKVTKETMRACFELCSKELSERPKKPVPAEPAPAKMP